MNTHIKNGHVIDPAQGLDKVTDIYIDAGRIAAVGKAPAKFTAEKTINADGLLVIPGIVDLSVRLREPGAEQKATIASETRAAAAGGITSLCYPPDTSPVIDTSAVVELINKRVSQVGQAQVYCLGALTHGLDGLTLASMQTLKEAGCIAVSNGYAALHDNAVLRRALEYAASCDLAVHLYCEDASLRGDGVMHDGSMSTRMGLAGIPAMAETIAISNALLLIEAIGTRVHFCRLSAARSVELIADARARGLPVSADVAINHLYLSEIDVAGFNSLCHLRPPLRTGADRQALRDGVRDGIIDAICSDHQPHDLDAKSAPFGLTEAGASTIDVLLPLVLQLVTEGVLDLPGLVRVLAANPAAIAGLDVGSLQTGARADITIIDPKAEWTVTAPALRSAGKNCPYLGWEMTGRAEQTLVGGLTVFNREAD